MFKHIWRGHLAVVLDLGVPLDGRPQVDLHAHTDDVPFDATIDAYARGPEAISPVPLEDAEEIRISDGTIVRLERTPRPAASKRFMRAFCPSS